MKIFKYELQLIEHQAMKLPLDKRILSVQVQDGNIVLWALVDETASLQTCHFAIYGTGHSLPENIGSYIATVQLDGFVWHIFEL